MGTKAEYLREYNQQPEVRARARRYRQQPEVKAKAHEYRQRPDVKARLQEYFREASRRYMARLRADPYLRAAYNKRKWAARRKRQLRDVYALSPTEADDLLSRDCAICGTHDKLVIDHEHNGKPNVRGILCASCNSGIGFLRDDPSRLLQALRYLEAGR